MVHILLPDSTDVDIIVAKWTWEADVIERAEPMQIGDVRMRWNATSATYAPDVRALWQDLLAGRRRPGT